MRTRGVWVRRSHFLPTGAPAVSSPVPGFPSAPAARLRLRPVMVVTLLAALIGSRGQAQSVSEYQMKAAYVYNLAKFVEWPSDAFNGASDPIAICVLGSSPIVVPLNEAVNGETIDDRKLVVRQILEAPQARGCQILFVGSSGRKLLPSILRDVGGPGILTVGEESDFAVQGGVVNFKLDAKRVQIQINLAAAERQKLRISPKLLSLAHIVGP